MRSCFVGRRSTPNLWGPEVRIFCVPRCLPIGAPTRRFRWRSRWSPWGRWWTAPWSPSGPATMRIVVPNSGTVRLLWKIKSPNSMILDSSAGVEEVSLLVFYLLNYKKNTDFGYIYEAYFFVSRDLTYTIQPNALFIPSVVKKRLFWNLGKNGKKRFLNLAIGYWTFT